MQCITSHLMLHLLLFNVNRYTLKYVYKGESYKSFGQVSFRKKKVLFWGDLFCENVSKFTPNMLIFRFSTTEMHYNTIFVLIYNKKCNTMVILFMLESAQTPQLCIILMKYSFEFNSY